MKTETTFIAPNALGTFAFDLINADSVVIAILNGSVNSATVSISTWSQSLGGAVIEIVWANALVITSTNRVFISATRSLSAGLLGLPAGGTLATSFPMLDVLVLNFTAGVAPQLTVSVTVTIDDT